jgi:asparagine synthase (glutamine-hydrolysing)
MCRIAGIASVESPEEARRLVQSMTGRMAHGGPDDEGIFQSGRVTLGHRRLSIIDLSSAGHQPMIHSNGQLVLSFNGEIYNYRELRKELQAMGISFRSNSDTEVILEGYLAWGPVAFSRFRGIFAFALLDVAKSKLLLVRDYPGIKPLYYHAKAGRVIFASEVKAFMQVDPRWPEDPNWKKTFLAFGYLPQPYTTLSNVTALRPGHYLDVSLDNLSVAERSFQPRLNDQDLYKTKEEALAAVRRAVETAVARNIVADAPLGVFLSGGIDSSLLTLLTAKDIGDAQRTVSINFDEAEFDEKPYQDMVLARTANKHHVSFRVNEQMLWESIDSIWNAMDQPTIDGVNSYFVSMAAHRAGLKAVLSGLGADELFGGYASASRVAWLKYLRMIPAKSLAAWTSGMVKSQYKRLNYLSLPAPAGDALFLRGIHSVGTIARILDCNESEVWSTLADIHVPRSPELEHANDATVLEYDFYMKGQLLKDTDFMSMRFALEARVPFLDQDLIAVACRALQNHQDLSQPKYLLTKAFEDVLPHEIIHRKKRGFTFPFHLWVARRLRSNNGDLLSQRLSNELPVSQFLAGKAHWSQVWSGVVLDHFKMAAS